MRKTFSTGRAMPLVASTRKPAADAVSFRNSRRCIAWLLRCRSELQLGPPPGVADLLLLAAGEDLDHERPRPGPGRALFRLDGEATRTVVPPQPRPAELPLPVVERG